MEFTTASRWRPDSRTRPTYSFCRGSAKPPNISCSSMSEKPMMALSGVRSSWLTAARKRLLAISMLSAVSADAASAARSAAISSLLRSDGQDGFAGSPRRRINSITKGR